MTRLLNHGGPREGASVGGSVGSPSHFTYHPFGYRERSEGRRDRRG